MLHSINTSFKAFDCNTEVIIIEIGGQDNWRNRDIAQIVYVLYKQSFCLAKKKFDFGCFLINVIIMKIMSNFVIWSVFIQWLTFSLFKKPKKINQTMETINCMDKQSVYKNKFVDLKSCIFINIIFQFFFSPFDLLIHNFPFGTDIHLWY